jgi:hypothetical protein
MIRKYFVWKGDGMKYEDVQHVYNVDFNNVRDCEFDGLHLAIVIKE